jgi:uncharacterized OsmC-like protein
MTDVRGYTTEARSTDTFGRVLVSARGQHLVVDGPVENGCPGEALTPPELFLAGVASCGVELLQVIARDRDVALGRVAVRIEGSIDRSEPPRSDVTVFNAVRMSFELEGVDEDDAAMLVKTFKGR